MTDVTDFYGWEFKLDYNPSLINATSVTEGSYLKTAPNRFLWIADGSDWIFKTYLADITSSIASWDTGTSYPNGVAYYNGYLYWVDSGTNTLYKVNGTTGSVSTSWDINSFAQDAFGLDCNGTHFAIADKVNDEVYFTTVGAPGTNVGYFAVDADTEGFCWVDGYWYGTSSNTDRVHKYSTTGTSTATYNLDNAIASSTGIEWDGTYWWISDDGDDLVYQLTQSDLEGGTYTTSFDTPGSDDQGLAYAAVVPASPRNTFFYINELNRTIGRINATGTILGDVPGLTGRGGVLATINFDIVAQGTSSLDLHNTKLAAYNYAAKTTSSITHVANDGSVTTGPVAPEFPVGAALEIALVGVIIYVWWRGRKAPKRFSVNTPPPNTNQREHFSHGRTLKFSSSH